MSLDICMLSPGLPHSGDTLGQRSLGGSETAAIMVSRALARRGHQITVFAPQGNGVHEGVAFRPIEEFAPYANGTPHDVTIVSRAVEAMRVKFNSKVTILWVHDLALKRNTALLGGVLWNLDAIYTPSAFMKRQYQEVTGLPENAFVITRNGVDVASFTPLAELPRDRHKLVYGSRPERGMENVLAIMELLGKRGSPAYCAVAWYDNVPPAMAEYYQALWQQAARMPNVRLLGPLKQSDWHREIATARAWIYPAVQGDFREISPVVGDTTIETLRGPKPIASLVGQSGFHVYSCDARGRISISRVNGVFQTRRDARVVRVTVRKGTGRAAKTQRTITLTPDHEVMLATGEYMPAGQLRAGDKLKAFYRRTWGMRGRYRQVGMTGGQQIAEHRLVMEWKLGRVLAPHEVVHHVDHDRTNNEPENLEVCTRQAHGKRHWDEADQAWQVRARQALDVGRSAATPRARTPARLHSIANARRIMMANAAARRENGSRRPYEADCAYCGVHFVRVGFKAKCCSSRCGALLRWRGVPKVALSNHVVMSVEDAGTADVFCMEVEPDHNFVANHIVVHNCISAMEAMAAGTPAVACARGAVPETLHSACAVFVGDERTDVHGATYREEFADAVQGVLEDDIGWRSMSHAARIRGSAFDWDGVAAQWEADWWHRLDARKADAFRVEAHCRRSGEHDVLEAVRQRGE